MANGEALYAGVDIGSTTAKAAIVDAEGQLLAFAIDATSRDRDESGQRILGEALAGAAVSYRELRGVCATGYGRKVFTMATMDMPEIMCHGRGTVALVPDVRTIVDIGGQDSKVIAIDELGLVSKFEMNDKCAAGTGRFFEVLSKRLLNIPFDDLNDLAMQSENPVQISSMCTVFAESEIISHLSEGVPVPDVAMGLVSAIVRRIYAMGNQSIGFAPSVVLSGGLAKSPALARAFNEKLAEPVIVLDNPQLPAALGAALMARDADMRD